MCSRCCCFAPQLRLSAFNTPYGDAQLDPVGIPRDVRQKLVWEELEHRMKRGEPVKVRAHVSAHNVPGQLRHTTLAPQCRSVLR